MVQNRSCERCYCNYMKILMVLNWNSRFSLMLGQILLVLRFYNNRSWKKCLQTLGLKRWMKKYISSFLLQLDWGVARLRTLMIFDMECYISSLHTALFDIFWCYLWWNSTWLRCFSKTWSQRCKLFAWYDHGFRFPSIPDI